MRTALATLGVSNEDAIIVGGKARLTSTLGGLGPVAKVKSADRMDTDILAGVQSDIDTRKTGTTTAAV